MELVIGADKQEVAEDFADFLVDLSLERTGIINIALSGGSTPKVVFDILASDEYIDRIDWPRIKLFWGDERCVPPDDKESNYLMTKNHLLDIVDIPEENIFRIQGENEPASEALRYGTILDTEIHDKNGIPYFDLVILGMGDDGHTASIFPHEIHLWEARENCVVATHPESGQKRVSLTGRVINNAEYVTFLVTGKAKAEKVNVIVNQEEGYEKLPASLVEPTSDNLIWFLDEAAAKLL